VLKEWLKSQGATLLLLPLQREVDEKALAPFAEGLPADWWLWAHWTEALEGIQRVAFLVAMRLHGLIAACLFSVPFVGIGYDPKVSGVLGEAFKGHLLPLSASAETVVAVLRQGMETADRFPDRADAFVTEQRRLARQNFLLLQDLL
jgi:polysaccharide pyruvyl transferase WcaK-like protein